MIATVKPVTLSGWYELTDGRVQRFDWHDGRLVDGLVVASWADVPTRPSWADESYVEAQS